MKTSRKLFQRCQETVHRLTLGVEFGTLFFTFVAFMLWAFLCVQALIGRQSIWWLLFGPLLVIVFGVIREVGWAARHEIASHVVFKLVRDLVKLLRDGFAVLAMIRVGQAINQGIEESVELSPWQALWQIIKGG